MRPPRADPLLSRLHIRAHIAFRGVACTRWAIAGTQPGRLAFHAVLSGECWAHLADRPEPARMVAGGLLLYRPSAKYVLTHSAISQLNEAPVRIAPLSAAPSGLHVGLLCGFFDGGTANEALLGAIPDCVLWPSASQCPQQIAAL